MRADPHLVVDLSGHGFGHGGMTVPVLNRLHCRRPELRITIRTTIPFSWLADRIKGPFGYVEQADFGMAMADARRVLPFESLAAYSRLHSNWPRKVAGATEQLAALKPTLLLSNVTYLSLAAAKRLGVPAIAFCSLNWADVFRHYCIHLPGADKIWAEMVESYAAAEMFIQTVPCMPMPSIRSDRTVGPVARVGRQRSGEVRQRLGLADDVLLVLLAPRGLSKDFSVSNWPRLARMRILLGSGQKFSHPGFIRTDTMGFSFIDLVRSCDVLIAKPGYGLVTEAACNGAPVLLLPWEDWPETLGLKYWLSRHGRTLELTDEKLRNGDFLTEVRNVLAMPRPRLPVPKGVGEIVEIIESFLPSASR